MPAGVRGDSLRTSRGRVAKKRPPDLPTPVCHLPRPCSPGPGGCIQPEGGPPPAPLSTLTFDRFCVAAGTPAPGPSRHCPVKPPSTVTDEAITLHLTPRTNVGLLR